MVEVATISSQSSLVMSDDCTASGAGESRDESTASVTWSDVLGGMAVFRRDDLTANKLVGRN